MWHVICGKIYIVIQHWSDLSSICVSSGLNKFMIHVLLPWYRNNTTMATPGRTHIPWQTQTAHIRELISYIGYLEAKVSYLQHHHERCGTLAPGPPVAGANLTYLPPDIVVAHDRATDESNIIQAVSSPTRASCTSALPTATQSSQQRIEGNPRWKQIVDQITTGWDKPSSWLEKRKAIGLDSVMQNKYALTAILGFKKDLPLNLARYESVSPDCVNATTHDLVMTARQYALDSKASQTNPGLIVQLRTFRELIFASLCVVMEHQGLPVDAIDSLMRICISSSGSANLYRLRRGALWVNRIISGTMMKKLRWGYASTEFFLLCRSRPHYMK